MCALVKRIRQFTNVFVRITLHQIISRNFLIKNNNQARFGQNHRPYIKVDMAIQVEGTEEGHPFFKNLAD